MGRAHEVRAKSMAATSAARSALFGRASKEIYMAAKQGVPDDLWNASRGLRQSIRRVQEREIQGLLSIEAISLWSCAVFSWNITIFEIHSSA